MSNKDWILLLFPIVCNGIVVLVLQKIFEKKRLVLDRKYKYVFILQQKVDKALELFVNVVQTANDDHKQVYWMKQYLISYCDVYKYYQQNQVLLKSLDFYMDEIMKIHTNLSNIFDCADFNIENRLKMGKSFRRIYELLQNIQNDCINYKI